jgi:hypothetical protein
MTTYSTVMEPFDRHGTLNCSHRGTAVTDEIERLSAPRHGLYVTGCRGRATTALGKRFRSIGGMHAGDGGHSCSHKANS